MKSESQKEAGAKILNEYGQFLKKQCQDFMLLTKLEPQDVNKTFQPITITLKPNEFMNTIDLVSSDNTLMTKILGVLSSLCVEVVHLREEAFESHFPFLAVYDEYNISSVSTQMEAICMLNAFVIRCDEVLRNLCSQVFALYVEDVINLNGIQLHYIINHISELLTVIVLTELLISNTSLGQKWQKYCKDLKNFSQTNENVNLSEARLKSVQGAIHKIGIKLFTDNIVQSCLEGLLTLKQKNTSKKSTGLSNELTQYLRAAITNLDKLVQENAQCATMYKCIKINCLFVLNANLYGVNDKKMFKVMMELNAKAHSIPIGGTAVWYPEQFLQRFLPSLCTSYGKLPQTMFKARQNYISSKKAALVREVTCIQAACTQWIIKVEDFFGSKHVQLNASQMSQHSKTILAGLEIASQLRYTILTFINLHLSLGMPLSRAMLMVIFESIDVLKDIQNAIQRNSSNIVISINMIVQHLTFQATSSVLEVKKHLMTDKSYGNQRLDELTCIVIAEKTLKGAATIERLVAANVALNFIPASTYEEDVYARLGILLEKVQTLTNFKTLIGNICDCSWLLWHQNIIPIYLQQNFTVELNSLRLKYFLIALDDCMKMLHKTDKQFGCDRSQDFLNNMKVLIDVNVLRSFSQQLETNLRLHTHSHLQLDVVNPFTMEMAKKVLLTIDNLKLMHLYLSVVPSVEHYLSTMYYNLTTVVLSDWKTYGEMRQMAKFKFHLETVQDHLPTQTLEQGLDVLEIMRNIHIFVSKYLYNLNNQIFVEKSSNNKHLNSINIRHIANSIRTHGTGIMNTTVNFTYQFLKKKFFTFSQFLYDEHIKSRLIKDLRFFKENASASGNMYPYRNADKFNKGIRSLGLAEDGQTYLDLFRDLISQIGNAMGYVRMIRSGGRHCCADATVFLPTLDEPKSFKTLSEECGLKQVVLESAEGLDLSIDSLISNFMQRTEYFKLLVEVFSPTFRNPKNVHLKNFFIIVPPLTLNFVEHMILSKDKMTKKNKVGAAFTDDGFAMGVAYILKLLDQDSSFKSLNWFDSVWKHFEEEKQALEDQKSKGTLQLQQALALTEKKLKTLEQEFQLLYYSLTSARIFFR